MPSMKANLGRVQRLLSAEVKRIRLVIHRHSAVEELTTTYALLCGMQSGYMLQVGRKHGGAAVLMKDILAQIKAVDANTARRAELHADNNFAVVRKMIKTHGTIPTKSRTPPRRSLR